MSIEHSPARYGRLLTRDAVCHRLGRRLRRLGLSSHRLASLGHDEPKTLRYEISSGVSSVLTPDTPGVGPITALAFRGAVDDPNRFAKSRAVGAHPGLTPARYQSGETDIQGRISRCGDELAGAALYEAAHTLLVRSAKWSRLRAWGMAVAKRRGMARARVAVARKLAVILHRMWRDQVDFRFGPDPAAA